MDHFIPDHNIFAGLSLFSIHKLKKIEQKGGENGSLCSKIFSTVPNLISRYWDGYTWREQMRYHNQTQQGGDKTWTFNTCFMSEPTASAVHSESNKGGKKKLQVLINNSHVTKSIKGRD